MRKYLPITKNTGFDPKEYWEKRLYDNFSLKGVGHIGFSTEYNRRLYNQKLIALNIALEKHNIEIKGKNILDVGCGTGFWVDFYNKRGAKSIVGIDITEIAIAMLKQKYQTHVFEVFDISDLNLNYKEHFNIVNAFDVIYHITNDRKFEISMSNISKSLMKEGYVLITDLAGKRDVFPAEHVHFRSKQKYERVCAANNIQILDFYRVFFDLSIVDKVLSKIYHNWHNLKLLIGKKF